MMLWQQPYMPTISRAVHLRGQKYQLASMMPVLKYAIDHPPTAQTVEFLVSDAEVNALLECLTLVRKVHLCIQPARLSYPSSRQTLSWAF